MSAIRHLKKRFCFQTFYENAGFFLLPRKPFVTALFEFPNRIMCGGFSRYETVLPCGCLQFLWASGLSRASNNISQTNFELNWQPRWGRDKMAAVFQTTFFNMFSWMKIYEFRSKFHWNLFLRVQLTIFRHWYRWWLCTDQATCHYLNQWWLDYRRIYASLVIAVKCHGLYPQSGKTPYRQIAWSLQAVRLYIMMIVSPWILTNISAVLLSRFLSFFRAIKKV